MNHHANSPPPPDLEDVAPLDIAPADEMLARLEARRSAPLRGLVEPGPTP
ncbi:MAG: nitroreductase, partial [Microvirga sp.]|nr:nitroreductase [Microvirga sp.]